MAVTDFTEEINAEHKEKNASKVFTVGRIRLYECPENYLTFETRELMNLFFLSENTGKMLFDGGIVDQPYWFIELMNMGKSQINESIKKERKDGN